MPSLATAPPVPPAVKPPAAAAARKAPATVAAAEPTSPAPTRSAVAGGAVLQIGAYETQEIADGAWAAFKARHAGIAGNAG